MRKYRSHVHWVEKQLSQPIGQRIIVLALSTLLAMSLACSLSRQDVPIHIGTGNHPFSPGTLNRVSSLLSKRSFIFLITSTVERKCL